MDSTIIAAIIQGGATVIAAALTAWIMRPKVNEPEAKAKTKTNNLYFSQAFWGMLTLVGLSILIYNLQKPEPVTRYVVMGIACNVLSVMIGVLAMTLLYLYQRFK